MLKSDELMLIANKFNNIYEVVSTFGDDFYDSLFKDHIDLEIKIYLQLMNENENNLPKCKKCNRIISHNDSYSIQEYLEKLIIKQLESINLKKSKLEEDLIENTLYELFLIPDFVKYMCNCENFFDEYMISYTYGNELFKEKNIKNQNIDIDYYNNVLNDVIMNLKSRAEKLNEFVNTL